MTTATRLELDRSAPTRAITRLAVRSLRQDRRRNAIVVGLVAAGVSLAVVTASVARSTASIVDGFSDGSSPTGEATVLGLLAGAVPLALTAALASGAFVTSARRRLREYGLLVANGASLSHVRGLVMRQASLLGALGSGLGALLGLVLAPAVLVLGGPFLETGRVSMAVHALDVVGPLSLGILASIVGAWVPAWLIGRVDATHALAGRMPTADSTRVRLTGPVLLTVAVVVMLTSFTLEAHRDALHGVAFVTAALGVTFSAGPVLAALGRSGGRLPLAPRLAVRDAARQRTRSAAVVVVLAAIFATGTAGVLVVGDSISRYYLYGPLPSGLAVVGDASADTQTYLDGAGVEERAAELAPLLAELPPVTGQVDVRYLAPWGATGRLLTVADADDASASRGLPAVVVLDPPLAELLGIDPLPPRTLLLSDENHDGPAPWQLDEGASILAIPGAGTIDVTVRYGSAPRAMPGPLWGALVSPDLAGALPDLREARVLQLAEPPLVEAAERVWAPWAGLRIEVSPRPPSRTAAILVGALVVAVACLAVALLATALAAAESDRDLETMVAVGADPSLRRRFHASLAGYHCLVGIVLGVTPVLVTFAVPSVRDAVGFATSGYVVPWPAWVGLALVPLLVTAVTYAVARPSRATVVSRRVD